MPRPAEADDRAEEHAAFLPGEHESEGRFLHLRRQVGLILAPALFLLVLAIPISGITPPAHRLAGIIAAVIVLWITEALPMPLTALIGAAACILMQVAPAKEVFLPFADPLIFLFIGSFILARAVFLHRLDRRLAFAILSAPWVGASPGRILIALGAVTAFISAFVANAATTAMMFAIAMSIINYLFDPRRGPPFVSRSYATGLMLMTTFAASVGGLATPVGAAPNLIGLGFIRNRLHVDFSFLDFCMVGTPAAIVLFGFVALYLTVLCRAGTREIPGGRELFRAERQKLGPWTWGQRSTVLACLVTITLWLAPAVLALVVGEQGTLYQIVDESVPEPVAALVGAALLFLLPGERSDSVGGLRGDSVGGLRGDPVGGLRGARAMQWEEAAKIDWGIILLFGGGLSLGILAFQTGLAEALGKGLAYALPAHSTFGLVVLATLTAALVSEVTSNTASANMVVPVVIVIAQAADVDPLAPALAATFGSGLGFMLPVSTPCNAIVYSSGYVPLQRMMAYGMLLDVVGIVVIITAVQLLVPWLR